MILMNEKRQTMLGRIRKKGRVSTREDLEYQTDTSDNLSLVIPTLEEPLKDLSMFAFVQSTQMDMETKYRINRK